MLLVLDSNVYIFGFGLLKDPACRNFVHTIIEKHSLHSLRISRSIVKEVRHHLSPEYFLQYLLK